MKKQGANFESMLTALHFSQRDGIGTDLTEQAFSAMVNLRSLVCLCRGSCKRKDASESTLESVKAKRKETTLKPRPMYFDANEGGENTSSSDARDGGMVILAVAAATFVTTASVTTIVGQGSGANKGTEVGEEGGTDVGGGGGACGGGAGGCVAGLGYYNNV